MNYIFPIIFFKRNDYKKIIFCWLGSWIGYIDFCENMLKLNHSSLNKWEILFFNNSFIYQKMAEYTPGKDRIGFVSPFHLSFDESDDDERSAHNQPAIQQKPLEG